MENKHAEVSELEIIVYANDFLNEENSYKFAVNVVLRKLIQEMFTS